MRQGKRHITHYTYDSTNQLVSAANPQTYALSVTYGPWGKIQEYGLSQTDLANNVTTSQTRFYSYGSLNEGQTTFAPNVITDNNGTDVNEQYGINGSLQRRETTHPDAQPNEELYRFGADGNLRLYSYDRLFYSLYGYNAANTRTYKYSFDLNPNWVNGRLEAVNFNPHTAMFYPNAYINFNNNGYYTKHYYNGTERIASRLGDQNLQIHTHDPELQDRKDWQDSLIRKNVTEITGYEFLPVGEEQDPDDPKPIYELPQVSITNLVPNTSSIYYYHPNHLGSTAFVTDQNQTIVQGFLYAPFGEITNEYNNSFGSSVLPKYSFNAKELDEETGMYYYEARYMAPPVFISRDPLFEKYPTFTPYAYCANNPVKYVDPDGRDTLENTDWVKKKGTNQYIWLDGVDCKATTPGIYDYVGPDDEDILKDMGISESFYTKQESRNGLTSRWRPPAVLGAIYSDRRNETTARFSVCAISIKNKKYASFANKEGRVFSGIRFSASVTQISLSIEGGWGGMDYKGGLTIGFADGKYPVYDYLTTPLGQQLNAEHHTTTDASCFITAEQIIKRGVPTTAKITLGYCNKASTNRPIEFNINLKSR